VISIVMPSYNQNTFIGEAISSVLTHEIKNLELIIADGGSTDGTVDYLIKSSQQDSRLKWLSEPDLGPADAINKALKRARGTVIGWLNSDDLYVPGAINRAFEFLNVNSDKLMVYGHGEHIDATGKLLSPYPTRQPTSGLQGFSSGCYICQPTVFFKRSMYVMLGDLDNNLKTAFDYDYWLRAFSSFPERIGFIDERIAKSRLHDACITQKQRRIVALEGIKLTHSYLGQAGIQWATSYFEHIRTEKMPHEFNAEVYSFLRDIAPFYDAQTLKQMQQQLEVG